MSVTVFGSSDDELVADEIQLMNRYHNTCIFLTSAA